jgi:hypothetical protein
MEKGIYDVDVKLRMDFNPQQFAGRTIKINEFYHINLST